MNHPTKIKVIEPFLMLLVVGATASLCDLNNTDLISIGLSEQTLNDYYSYSFVFFVSLRFFQYTPKIIPENKCQVSINELYYQYGK